MHTASPANPAVEAVLARASAQIAAMFDECNARKARINADPRIIGLRKLSAALWSDIPEGMDGAEHLFREISEGRVARRRRVASLIRARIAQLDDYQGLVRRELRDAAACRRQSPRNEAIAASVAVGAVNLLDAVRAREAA